MTFEEYDRIGDMIAEMESIEQVLKYAKNETWKFYIEGTLDADPKQRFETSLDIHPEVVGDILSLLRRRLKELEKEFEEL